LAALARKRGIVTLLDAAQSAGHLPLDVRELGCDFVAFSGHKMCGPTGIGVLYGRAELLEVMPPWHGGGEMIRQVDFAETSYADPPYKFEAGTPNIAGAVGLRAAMDYLDAAGRKQIYLHDQELAAYAVEQLSRLEGVRLLGPRGARAGIVTFTLPDVHAHDLVILADEYGIALRGGHHCAQPLAKRLELGPTTRASFYLYNTFDEIDWLVEVIHKVRKTLAE
jgi:cysteine desulfurase/selenocysteine lyase